MHQFPSKITHFVSPTQFQFPVIKPPCSTMKIPQVFILVRASIIADHQGKRKQKLRSTATNESDATRSDVNLLAVSTLLEQFSPSSDSPKATFIH
jgi:hypothetical protein